MAEKTKFWYLKHFNIFEGMDEETMKNIDRMSSMIAMETHQPIYFPDEPSRSIFFLKEGHVKISRLTSDGKEMILDVIGPGEIFGELVPTTEDEPLNELAQTLDHALICTMKRTDFENILKSRPQLSFELTKRIGLRLRKVEERITDLMFKDVRRRIASLLIKLAEEFGKVKQGTVAIRTPLSHQEIAFLTGSARQTVTTTLNEFRELNLIDFSRQGITIKDFDRLKLFTK